MMNRLAFVPGTLLWTKLIWLQSRRKSRLLPPRSMVGQPPLERHIGVRIPGGQPEFESKAVCRSDVGSWLSPDPYEAATTFLIHRA